MSFRVTICTRIRDAKGGGIRKVRVFSSFPMPKRLFLQKIRELGYFSNFAYYWGYFVKFPAALAVAQKVFKGLHEKASNSAHVSAYLAILAAIADVSKLVVKELTNWITTRPKSPKSLQQSVEVARNYSADVSVLAKEDNSRLTQRDEKKSVHNVASRREDNGGSTELAELDTADFRNKVLLLFAEWFNICELPTAHDSTCANYVSGLHESGFLKGDDISQLFFRCLTEISVSHCLASEASSSVTLGSSQPLSFFAIDMYARLVFNILKFYPVDQGSSKLNLLLKILELTVSLIKKDAEEKNVSFNSRPYFRLFINWILDMGSMDPQNDGAHPQVLLSALAKAFHSIQPASVPGFSFAWLELISHRSFMPKLLTGNGQKGWPFIHRLLLDLLQFLEPYLRGPSADISEPVKLLYKGCLWVMLVLLHDYPDFLCQFHFAFCDVIPTTCIQLRNIILSAFPRCMKLPNPSAPNLKIDLLPESSQPPRILSEVDFTLKAKDMKGPIDEYLKTRQQGPQLLAELQQKLLLSPAEAATAGTRYDVPLMNSLVVYVGMQAIEQLQAKSQWCIPPSSSNSFAAFFVGAGLDIFQMLISDLDSEGRYLFLNVMANQLRYPSNHTFYFSFLLLYLFYETKEEMVQEQITRVIFERVIVNRPQPWGVLITFTELVKNPRYKFWSKPFIRCDPEIEDLFETVCTSYGCPKTTQLPLVVEDNI